MRLGDLDALKETLFIKFGNQLPNGLLDEINNAPTVEPTYVSDMPDGIVKDLKELAIDYGEGIAVFERKRPKGEWIYDYDDFYHCSICGKGICTEWDKLSLKKYFPFCHCGADMRGGAE